MNKLTTKDFIERANFIHKEKYDYSLCIYEKMNKKIKIICPIHGIFEQLPGVHLRGFGCSFCSGNKKIDTEIFIEKSMVIHNNKYDYSLVNYKNNYSKIKIICPVHGMFEQVAKSHLKGFGCSMCSNKSLKNSLSFIKESVKIHGLLYDYSLVIYNGAHKKVKIICPEHGVFEITPNWHLRGSGCNKCVKRKGESKIENILIDFNVEYIKQKTFEGCKNKRLLQFDFYLPNQNLCIEYDGIQHFKPIEYFGGEERLKQTIINDIIKDNFCKENNINLLRIKYDDTNIKELICKSLI